MYRYGLSVSLAAFLSLGVAAAPARAAGPPNLVLIVAEDLSARIGAFGDPVARTPNLDRLASQGVRFPNVFTTAGVCAPSRAALITGVHQIAIGGQHMRTSTRPAGAYRAVPPPDVKAFPELLRGGGYYTSVNEKLDYQFSGVFTGSGPFTIWDAEGGEEGNEDAWRGRPEGAPFFAMFNLMETHESGVFAPLGSWPHSALHFLMQVVRAWQFGVPDPRTTPDEVSVPSYWPDTETVRTDLARHYDNVEQMDAHVGRILDRLEADGLTDSTIVVWTTDHGDGLPRAKRELYDSGIRVPMIVRWPAALRPAGRRPGDVDPSLISFVDLAPTLLEWAGVVPPDVRDGRSLAQLAQDPRRHVFASRDRVGEILDRQRAVRSARFKYIRSWVPEQPGGHRLAFRDNLDMMRELWALHEAGALDARQRIWFEPPGRERLFDVVADPEELNDLAQDPASAADLARMRAVLEAWLAQTDDWSETPEDDMVQRFQPDGVAPVTAAPRFEAEAGRLAIRSETEGASIGVRIADGPWRLYTAPFVVAPGTPVVAKAVRYGWDESGEAGVVAP